MKGAVVSSAVTDEIIISLKKICENVFLLPPDESISPPVAHHPDMILSLIGKKLVCHKKYLEKNRKLMYDICETFDLDPVGSDVRREARYPYDIAFNALVTRGHVFCNRAYTAPEVLSLASSSGLEIVNVRQGYARCSSVFAGETVVSADPSILGAAEKCGLSVFSVPPGGISLAPYDTGFIGGASGCFDGTLYTFGDLRRDGRFDKLTSFLDEKNIRLYPLCSAPLSDFGGIKFF